jgi:hypothetical protein
MKSKRCIVSVVLVVLLVAVVALAIIWSSRTPKSIPGYYTYQFTRPIVIVNKSGHKAEVELWTDKEIKNFILQPNQSKHFRMKAGIYPIHVWKTEGLRHGIGTSFDVEGDILTKWLIYQEGLGGIYRTFYISPATVENIKLKDKLYYFKLSEVWPIPYPKIPEIIIAEIEFGEFGKPFDETELHFWKNEPGGISLDGESYKLEFQEVIKRADCKTPVKIDIIKVPLRIQNDYNFDLKIN